MNLPRSFSNILLIALLIFAIVLSASTYLIYNEVKRQGNLISALSAAPKTTVNTASPVVTDTCGTSCKSEISSIVSQAVASVSGTKTIVEKAATPAPTMQTSYITMGGTNTTTSTDWETIEDSATYINIANDYGQGAKVTWSASLKVAHGNGQAFARLYDATHNIAVDGSELSTTNNTDYATVTSGALPFWMGNNVYKVQVKSLNSFEVTYSGGKIKIEY